MPAVAATIIAAVLAGAWAQRRWGARAEEGGRRLILGLLYTVVPFVAFFNITRLELDADVVGGLALAYPVLAAVGLVAWAVAARGLRLDRPATGALIVSAVQANTGFVGLPLAVTLLGGEHLGPGAAYDTAVTVPFLFAIVFAVGAAFGTRAGVGVRQRTWAFVWRNPPLLAVAAALVAPDSWAPDALVDVSQGLVIAAAPLGFFAVGIALSAESAGRLVPRLSRPVGAAVALRVLVAPALLFVLAAPLIDIPDAYLLLAAMPTGVNALTVSHAYGLDIGIAAGAIAWSTLAVLAAGLAAALV